MSFENTALPSDFLIPKPMGDSQPPPPKLAPEALSQPTVSSPEEKKTDEGQKPPVSEPPPGGAVRPHPSTRTRKPETPEVVYHDILAMYGFLLWRDLLVLPRQVVPFCSGSKLLAPDLQFVRRQIHCRLFQSAVNDPYLVTSATGKNNWSDLASRKTCETVVRPDGPCGFTGAYLEQRGSRPLQQVKEWCRWFDIQRARKWHQELDPIKSGEVSLIENQYDHEGLAAILPKFYLELPAGEVAQLREAGSEHLKEVYDISRGAWLWLYEMGHEYMSPVVVSERPGFRPEDADLLHHTFAGHALFSRVWIGGSGFRMKHDLNTTIQTAMELMRPEERRLVGQTYPLHSFFSTKTDAEVEVVKFRLPREDRPRPQKNKPNSEERRDSFAEFVETLVNRPAQVMARRVLGMPI